MLLALDVCGNDLYIAEGSYGSGKLSVNRVGSFRLPEGTVEDGVIRNHAALVSSLQKALSGRRYHASSGVFTFNSSLAVSRRLELPSARPRELAMMARNEMIQVVSDAAENVFDYSVVGPGSQPGGKTTAVWGYALPRELVDGYYAVFKSIRLRPAALDIHTNSVDKLFSGATVNGRSIAPDSVLFADVEKSLMELHLFSEGYRVFSRISPASSSELGMLLSNAGIRTESGEVFESLDLNDEKVAGDIILREAVQQYVGRLADELQKMIQFQLRRNSQLPVTQVYLYGVMAQARGLAERLAMALDLNVEPVESISGVRSADRNILRHIHAVGSLIRL